jgi:hypothetical protein
MQCHLHVEHAEGTNNNSLNMQKEQITSRRNELVTLSLSPYDCAQQWQHDHLYAHALLSVQTIPTLKALSQLALTAELEQRH